jgi:cytosine/creatinine deaminase
MPVVDGDIWTECRMLMEACRYYDIDAVAEWACTKPLPATWVRQDGAGDAKGDAGAAFAPRSVHALERRLASEMQERKTAAA